MSTDNRTPQEAEYDRMALSARAIGAQPEASHFPYQHDGVIAVLENFEAHLKVEGVHHEELALVEPTMLSVADQLAELGKPIHDIIRNSRDVEIGELPGGSIIKRDDFDGAPAAWIGVKHGEVEIDINPDGTIAGLAIGTHYLDDISEQEYIDLHTLLSHDRAQLGRIADMGPAVEEAREAWENLPTSEKKPIAASIGFAEWMRRRAAGEPIDIATLQPAQPKPCSGKDIGQACASLYHLLSSLDGNRVRRLLGLLTDAQEMEPEQQLKLVDMLLYTAGE